MSCRNRAHRVVDEAHQVRVFGNRGDRRLRILQRPQLFRDRFAEVAAAFVGPRYAGLFQLASPPRWVIVPDTLDGLIHRLLLPSNLLFCTKSRFAQEERLFLPLAYSC